MIRMLTRCCCCCFVHTQQQLVGIRCASALATSMRVGSGWIGEFASSLSSRSELTRHGLDCVTRSGKSKTRCWVGCHEALKCRRCAAAANSSVDCKRANKLECLLDKHEAIRRALTRSCVLSSRRLGSAKNTTLTAGKQSC